MPKTPTARDRAVELEQDAVRYPKDRSEILLEAAHEWKRAGEPERAITLWREVINAGGKDAGFARYSLAELCFEQGRDAEAREHLRVLEDEGVRDPGPAGRVAELRAERGEDEAALRCFNRAISALGADEIAGIGEPGGNPSVHAILFFGRRDCRHRLGLPADDWDRVAEVADQNRLDFVRLLERAAASPSKRPASAGAPVLGVERGGQGGGGPRGWAGGFPARTRPA